MHNGYRHIDKAKDYESQVQAIYDNAKQREFSVLIDGQMQNRIADAVANIGDDLVAIEAKYVDNWGKSISNPSHIKDMPFLGDPPQKLLVQAKAYSNYFDKSFIIPIQKNLWLITLDCFTNII